MASNLEATLFLHCVKRVRESVSFLLRVVSSNVLVTSSDAPVTSSFGILFLALTP